MNPANDIVSNRPKINNQNDSGSARNPEQEPIRTTSEGIRIETSEPEIPQDVKEAGLEKIHDEMELPPDVKKLGVAHYGTPPAVSVTTTLPQVTLPISDPQVVAGLHEKVTNALRWISIWCIRKLKKAHIVLKVIHGKIIRVRN